MLPVPTTVRLILFILGVSAQFLCPYPGYFFFLTANCLFRFLLFSVRFNLVFSPRYIPDLRSMAFLPDTILSPDSFPFVSLPTDYQLELPDILRSEILDQSISRMTIIHIFCYNCCNLIFLLSWCHSPFIYHFRRDALNQGPLLKSFFFANQLPATPYKPSLCLLFTGAWHAPVIRSSSRIFTNESSHAFHTYPNTLVLPFPVLPRLVLF